MYYIMNAIIAKLGLQAENEDTKITKKDKKFTSVKSVVPPAKDLNFMADLLFLPEATIGKKKYPYCLVVCDLASNAFDIEPVSNKEPQTILDAFKIIDKRKFIKVDAKTATLATDGGNEFKVVFAKWLYDESIFHKITFPNRHTQLSNINYLTRQLGKLFNLYMNSKERETGKVYKNWTDIIAKVRDVLNEHRLKVLPKDLTTYEAPIFNFNAPPNKYEIGDIVIRKLDTPQNALSVQQSGPFREGDIRWGQPQKIERVLYYPPSINYRYILSGIKNASFTEGQLRPSEAKQEEYKVKAIIDDKKEGGKLYYKVWWQGYKKEDASWEPNSSLKQDVPQLIKDYVKANK